MSDEKCPIEPGVCPDCDRPYTVPDGLDPFDSGRCLDCEFFALRRQLAAANAVVERLRKAGESLAVTVSHLEYLDRIKQWDAAIFAAAVAARKTQQ